MTRKKISTTVYLTDDQVARLDRIRQRTKVPTAEFIRQAIDGALERVEAAHATQVGVDEVW